MIRGGFGVLYVCFTNILALPWWVRPVGNDIAVSQSDYL